MDSNNPYLLLTPGPLSTTASVKQTMLRDWCTWDEDYNLGVVQPIRNTLTKLATAATGYSTVLMQGSGSFSVESVIGSCVPKQGQLLVLVNGAYGERIATMARQLDINTLCLVASETQSVSTHELDEFLTLNQNITHVATVHCETTTGILNPIEQYAPIIKQHQKVWIVDAMSSFGGIPIDIDALGIHFLISSANKCIQGVPGFGFIIAKESELENCKGLARSHSLDLYDQWHTMEQGQGKWRFTSPTHVVRAFQKALEELAQEGGISARHARYQKNHDVLVNGMTELGFRCVIEQDKQSPFITTFHTPESEKFDFKTFYTRLKEYGFVIYPGKVAQTPCFRIGHIGDVQPADIEVLLNAISKNRYWI
ncbi:MAG: 2-aminoethylphosphonate-pyruvate transaminase [Oceanicoccus sp.]|jgi:2-aminoethylphosphonate-pyruvate transaminase